MAISAAGIISEAVLTLISAYVWYFSKPGMVNSLAFYLMAVSFVSTVLFNGNPLMKFDGYFLLIDYLGIPNLQTKSFGYLRYLFLNRVLGISITPNTASSEREVVLFGVYGASAVLYRVTLYVGIVSGVYYRFDKLVGILLASLAFALFVVRPMVRGARSVYGKRREIRLQPGAALMFVLLVLVIIAPLFIPVASKSVYPCYVVSAQVRKLTVPLRTSIAQVFVKPWDFVAAGTVLFELDDSELQLALMRKRADREILQLELEMIRLDSKEMGKSQSKLTELSHAEEELRQINEDLKTTKEGIIAPFSGVITSLEPRLRPGFKPGAGAVVGEVRSLDGCLVQALLPEHDRNKVRIGQQAEVWLPIGRGRTVHRPIESIKPYHERDLKDSPFSSRLGGELATEVKGESHMDAPLVAQYKCSISFANEGHEVPLGIVGRFTVVSPPRSIVSRLLSGLQKTFRTELLL